MKVLRDSKLADKLIDEDSWYRDCLHVRYDMELFPFSEVIPITKMYILPWAASGRGPSVSITTHCIGYSAKLKLK